MYKYDTPTLKIGDKEESYIFLKTPTELITVQFTEWNRDIITKAKFTIHASDTHRELVAVGKCVPATGNNQHLLSLHSIRLSNQAPFAGRVFEFPVNRIDLDSNHFLNFRYVRYNFNEVYDPKWSCENFLGASIPDLVPGGVVKKP